MPALQQVNDHNLRMPMSMPERPGFETASPEQVPAKGKPSILLLTTSYPLSPGSVSGVFVKRLACALAEVCQLEVLAPSATQRGVHAEGEPSVHEFRYAPRAFQVLAHGAGGIPTALRENRFNALLIPLFLLSMLWSCWKLAKGKDVLFANWSICGVIAGVIGALRGTPVVVTLRGEDANRVASSLASRWMLRLCGWLCSRIVTVSEAMGSRLQLAMPALAQKLEVIPNGVAQPFLSVSPTQAGSEELRLLCVASLIPRKSVSTLVRALALSSPNVSLTLIGEGGEQASLEALATRLGVRSRIEFLPFQAPEKLPAYLAAADVLVLPSRAEGRPNVVLEAFAASRPVIATAIDGLFELVGQDQRGLLFPVGDSEALARCIARLGDFELRSQLGVNARRYIEDEGLTWQRSAQRYANIFQYLRSRN
ncbi:glycosyltransferase family 4 protein [Pseudomonas sp. AOB-7]|nr:glycosyltransferase family 4 protein [Pseudomonas sp. AOB-7]